MARTFVDISIPLENGVESDPPGYGPQIKYQDHHVTAPSTTFVRVPSFGTPEVSSASVVGPSSAIMVPY
jgi:hypothetical protein